MAVDGSEEGIGKDYGRKDPWIDGTYEKCRLRDPGKLLKKCLGSLELHKEEKGFHSVVPGKRMAFPRCQRSLEKVLPFSVQRPRSVEGSLSPE